MSSFFLVGIDIFLLQYPHLDEALLPRQTETTFYAAISVFYHSMAPASCRPKPPGFNIFTEARSWTIGMKELFQLLFRRSELRTEREVCPIRTGRTSRTSVPFLARLRLKWHVRPNWVWPN